MIQIDNKQQLQNFKVNTKVKLAALWTSVTFCYLYGDYFELYVPQKVAGLISGNNLLNSPLKLLLAAMLLAIPPVMVFLSVLLKPKFNRILNIITGTFFTIIMILIGISSLESWRGFYVFYALLESVITVIIVWTSFKWPFNIKSNEL
jgi:hypothetical protein